MYFRNIVEQLSKRQIYINLKIKKFNTFNTFIFEKYFPSRKWTNFDTIPYPNFQLRYIYSA